MKIVTILGTRPEIIRLALVIKKLDHYCDHILVHTGQNYDRNLNDIFFDELELRRPDYYFDSKSETFTGQISKILTECEDVLKKEKPDRVLILGDTNSALSSMVAKRMGIPVYHMEAGNRCYDDRVPEEVNRRIIDHSSDIWMPYTEKSRRNLELEGIPSHKIYVTGNPILEVIRHYGKKIESADILSRVKVKPKEYFLITLHRSENVDVKSRLETFILTLKELIKSYKLPVVLSLHPRTKSKIKEWNIDLAFDQLIISEPFGFFDFVRLEQDAFCVLTDSGTVQEECCILNVPNVTIRDVTERPETIESGSNIITGCDKESISSAVKIAVEDTDKWSAPSEYLKENVSSTVVKILLGYAHK